MRELLKFVQNEEITKMRRIGLGIIIMLFVSPSLVFADSLWNNKNPTGQSLFSDQKAAKVGDIITVLIVENTVVSQKASSARDKKSSIEGEVKDWAMPIFDNELKTKVADKKPIWKVENTNKFSGGGSYSGNFNIRSQITTCVIEVLPNNNLVIEGTSEVLINNEKNTIAVSGIVRPEDIGVANTILSTQLADAKVRILGKGPLHDKTGRGILETLLDWLWPF